MTEWTETKFSEKPETILPVAPGLYMQVRNINFVSDEEGYSCETREVTESELKLLGEISDLEQKLYSTNAQLLNII